MFTYLLLSLCSGICFLTVLKSVQSGQSFFTVNYQFFGACLTITVSQFGFFRQKTYAEYTSDLLVQCVNFDKLGLGIEQGHCGPTLSGT